MKRRNTKNRETLPRIMFNQKDKQANINMKKDIRVKSERNQLYHVYSVAQWRNFPGGVANIYRCYGTAMNGNSNKGWGVSFDIFPSEDKVLHGILQNFNNIVHEGEEKRDCGWEIDLMDFVDESQSPAHIAHHPHQL
jgi:hypothetical protein